MSESIKTGQPLPESIKPRTEDPLKIGRKVAVQRTDRAELDFCFKIISFTDDGIVIVEKDQKGAGRVERKKIPLKELELMNPPYGRMPTKIGDVTIDV